MIKKTTSTIACTINIITMLLLSCLQSANEPESKSEKIFGYIYNSDGTGASGALVNLIRSDYVPSGQGLSKKTISSITTTTNNNGKFTFNNLTPGKYNIFGSTQNGSDASYSPSIEITDTDNEICITNDTLRPAGSIKGKIRFTPYADCRAALILMLGSTRMAWPEDGLGNFKISDLGEGTYKMRIMPTNAAYQILDTSVTVFSAETTDVGTITLEGKQVDTMESDTILVRTHSISGCWGPDKVYKIMCDVVIPQGKKLEIKEGTQIIFMGNYDFGTDGNCVATGSVDKPVIFTYGLHYSGTGWNYLGIYRQDGGTRIVKPDSLIFQNCIIEYCKQPMWELYTSLSQFHLEMKNCILRYMDYGLSINFYPESETKSTDDSHIVISNSIFHDIRTANTLSGIEYLIPLIYIQNLANAEDCMKTPFLQVTNNIFFHERWPKDFNRYFPHNCYDTLYFDSIDSTCVFGDPEFIDIKKGDYHLGPNSPCRGTGTNGMDLGLQFN